MKRILAALMVSLLVMYGMSPSPATADSTPDNCESCHGDPHDGNPPSCSSCHWAPHDPGDPLAPEDPQPTGSHLLHYSGSLPSVGSLTYGDTTVSSTQTEYKFGCGNCHPLDRAKHRDGTLQVELYDALAPAGSLKAKNPATAAYATDTKTCSNVYCHSGYTVTSGPVGPPLTYPAPPGTPLPPNYMLNGNYIMDESCSNYAYAPITVNHEPAYKSTPAWGTSGTFTTCQECHNFPPTTYSPTVQAGVGDSHQWIDANGNRNIHAMNMLGDPIPCRTCHYTTVTAYESFYNFPGGFVSCATPAVCAAPRGLDPPGCGGTWNATLSKCQYVYYWGTVDVYVYPPDPEVRYNPVPLASHVTHVNGVPDVAFDKVNPVPYNGSYGLHFYSLVPATYDPSNKTCSDVACHYNQPPLRPAGTSLRWQRKPQWGTVGVGGNWGSGECDICHRYGSAKTCTTPPVR